MFQGEGVPVPCSVDSLCHASGGLARELSCKRLVMGDPGNCSVWLGVGVRSVSEVDFLKISFGL